MRGQLFKFTNREGRAVKGVLYGHAAGRHGIGVVYLPGIVLGATAVHRLGIDLARQLTQDGIPVCLFDPSGVGESEGDFPAGTHQEVAAWVEGGNCVDDTMQAVDFFQARTGVRELILVGHCGGALTAIYAAARHPAISGALLICPPTVTMGHTDELDREGVARIYFSQYLDKLRSREAWLRLLRGRSSYQTILRLVTGKARRQLERVRSRLRPAATVAAEPQRAFNPRLLGALRTAHADRKRLAIVFGDRDPDIEDFRDFHRRHVPSEVATRIFDDTSHGFVTEESMALLFGEVRRFVGAAGGRVVT
jgi:pimeloyl-ACP methyl ester carboxylesterase